MPLGLVEFVAGWMQAIFATARILICRPATILLLFVALCSASALIAFDLAYRYGRLDDVQLPIWFDLSVERGLGEIYEYCLVGTGAFALGLAAIRLQSWIFGGLAALLAYLVADNSLELHERMGEWMGQYLPTTYGLDPGHSGEALYMGGLAMIVLAICVALLRRNCDRLGASAAIIIGLVGLTGIFGIGVDAFTATLEGGEGSLLLWLTGLEDGGELVCFGLLGAISSAIAWESRFWIEQDRARIAKRQF